MKKRGRVASLKNGDKVVNKKGQTAVVVDYQSALKVLIEINGVRKYVTAQQLRSKSFTDRKNYDTKKTTVEQPYQQDENTYVHTNQEQVDVLNSDIKTNSLFAD